MFESDDVRTVLVESMKTGETQVRSGATIYAEGGSFPYVCTVLSGWVFRYKTLPNSKRQILGFGLSGDMIGLHHHVVPHATHSVEALTPSRLCMFSRERIDKVYDDHPHFARELAQHTARSQQMTEELLLSVGQRTAIERIAYLLLHLFEKTSSLGLAEGQSMPFPLTQQHVADTLGMSLVHTNKTLAQFVKRGIITIQPQRITFHDVAALQEIASYDQNDHAVQPLF